MSNALEERGGLQKTSAGHAPCIYVVNVGDLSVTQDVVSVTHGLVSVTLEEAANGDCRSCSPTCVDHSHPVGFTVRIAADLCVLSVVILELIKTTTCNSCSEAHSLIQTAIEKDQKDLKFTIVHVPT